MATETALPNGQSNEEHSIPLVVQANAPPAINKSKDALPLRPLAKNRANSSSPSSATCWKVLAVVASVALFCVLLAFVLFRSNISSNTQKNTEPVMYHNLKSNLTRSGKQTAESESPEASTELDYHSFDESSELEVLTELPELEKTIALFDEQLPGQSHPATQTEPCINFYEHVCSQQPQLDSNTSLSSSHLRAHQFSQSLLQGAFQSSAAKSSSNSVAVHFLTDLHQECVQLNATLGDNVTHYLDYIISRTEEDYLELTDRPVEEIFADTNTDADATTDAVANWLNLFARYYSMTGEGLLVNLEMYSDLADRSKRRFAFDQPSAEEASIEDSLVLLMLTSPFNISRKAIYELAAFNRLLSIHPKTITLGPWVEQEKLTFGGLNELTDDTVDWTALVNAIMARSGSELSIDDDVPVYADVSYLKHVLRVVKAFPVRVIRNYVTLQYFRYLKTVIPYKDEDCLLFPKQEKMFTFAYSRIFAEAFIGQTSRQHLEAVRSRTLAIAKHVKEAFSEMLFKQHQGPVDIGAFFRMLLLDFRVAYEDWFMDDGQLDAWYDLYDWQSPKVIKGDYVGSLRSWLRHWVPVQFTRYSNFTVDKQWPKPIFAVNGFYHELLNDIFITLGYLTPPMFNLTASEATHFGIIGTMIGHEIGHAFSRESGETFHEKVECLLEQYATYTAQALPGLRRGRNQTLQEDISDNSGLKAAYRGYQSRLEELSALAGGRLVQGDDQQFFIGFAQQFCRSQDIEKIRQLAAIDRHSAPMVRVNVPLANFEPFARAFNCQRGSPMNPEKRCTIW